MKVHKLLMLFSVSAAVLFAGCEKDPETPEIETETITAAGVQFTMVKVTPGTFTMGPIAGDNQAYNWEQPAHQVTLTQSYYIGQTEVTQELYQAVMGVNPSFFNNGTNLPVEQVTYYQAREFCTRLSNMTGHTFRLPTEAQWEYAARGGQNAPSTPTLYSGSDNPNTVGWHLDNSGNKTHTVGTKEANALGLYDMTGNVYEWCLDFYGAYPSDAQTDPLGPDDGQMRVLRGGAWSYRVRNCRVSDRSCDAPSILQNYIGFRVVMIP
ncbi:MAG: formylglycine-generating enzyme family protein [Bacteroidales bacterium]|nr:formylglycine-generating enzyme family protein [Bacteroidales bacterium]